MAGETTLTAIGNITADPELRMAGNTPVVNFNVAVTPSRFNRQSGQFEDGVTNFFPVKAFGDLASHIARSITKGMRVSVTGRVETETWDHKDQNGNLTGEKRTRQVINADDVAVSLRYGAVTGFQKSAPNAQAPAQMAPAGAPQMAQPVMQQPQQQQFVPAGAPAADPVQQQFAQPQAAPAPAPAPAPQAAPAYQAPPQPQQVMTQNGPQDLQF